MKTRADVINRAFRMIGVKAEDEALTADQFANGGEVLDALFAEIDTRATQIHGTALDFTLATVPDDAFLPLSGALAASVAAEYQVQAPASREASILRLLSVLYPDNRETAEAVFY